ncbi:GxxExxY protein [Patescibacteria group bacterium]|nr:GxxExxY protein [Patescibacteria group bacterium]
MAKKLLYKDLVYRIQGILFEVYKTLGPGFKESIYQNAIEEELIKQEITYKREPSLKIKYKNKEVGVYKPDFVVDEKVLLEIKALPEMPAYFETQLFNYLKATKYKLGLLVNFGCDGGVDIRRRILTQKNTKVLA